MGKESCHISAKEFRSKISVRKSGFTGKYLHQSCHHTNPQTFFVIRFRQKNRNDIGRNHPVWRKAGYRWGNQVQQHTDCQHQRRDRQPAETSPLALVKTSLDTSFIASIIFSPSAVINKTFPIAETAKGRKEIIPQYHPCWPGPTQCICIFCNGEIRRRLPQSWLRPHLTGPFV